HFLSVKGQIGVIRFLPSRAISLHHFHHPTAVVLVLLRVVWFCHVCCSPCISPPNLSPRLPTPHQPSIRTMAPTQCLSPITDSLTQPAYCCAADRCSAYLSCLVAAPVVRTSPHQSQQRLFPTRYLSAQDSRRLVLADSESPRLALFVHVFLSG